MSVWFHLIVFCAGVIGSMGMGGGTLLIPALVFLGGIGQHSAQAYNLIAFAPVAVYSIIFYWKNKMINYKVALFCAFFAASTAVGASFLAQKIDGKILAIILGAFMIVLAVFQASVIVIKIIKNKRTPR